MEENNKKPRKAFPRSEKVREGGVVPPKPRGRPKLPEGSMVDVTIRLSAQAIADAVSLVPEPTGDPEVDKSRPTKAAILRQAILLGLEELKKERQSEREEAEIRRLAISLGLKALKRRVKDP
jgi:hypothetical protein